MVAASRSNAVSVRVDRGGGRGEVFGVRAVAEAVFGTARLTGCLAPSSLLPAAALVAVARRSPEEEEGEEEKTNCRSTVVGRFMITVDVAAENPTLGCCVSVPFKEAGGDQALPNTGSARSSPPFVLFAELPNEPVPSNPL